MTIAYVFNAEELDSAEFFLNRFLKGHCKEATGTTPYVASLFPSADRLSKEQGLDINEVLESQELRGKLLNSMYSGLWQATQKNRPVVSLRNNLSRQARSRFLERIPTHYERICVSILPVTYLPTQNEGFDKLWVLEREPLEGGVYQYTFLEGSFEK
jgi:hypothetical protein